MRKNMLKNTKPPHFTLLQTSMNIKSPGVLGKKHITTPWVFVPLTRDLSCARGQLWGGD